MANLPPHIHLRKLQLWKFALIVGALYSIVVAGSEFVGVPVEGAYSIATTIAQWAVVAVCATGLIALIAASRWIFATVFPALMLVCGAMMYLHFATGTRLTALSVELALVNDAAMWWSMMSTGLILSALAGAAVGALTAVYRWRRVVATTRSEPLIVAAAGAAVVLCPVALVSRIAAPVGARLPYSIYFSVQEYLANRQSFSEVRNTFAHEAPSRDIRPAPDVIFVIGESLRADHLPMNGYGRNTMPRLSADSAVVSLPKMFSEATHTFASVPAIMTRADSLHPDRAYEEQSFISLFRKVGYRTAWIANQDLSRSYTYFAHEADTLVYCTSAASLYDYEKWLDSATLPHLHALLAAANNRPLLAVIHSIGSHWWYKSHYTDNQTVFMPDVRHKDVGGLSHEEMVNGYDNTIIATDDFLADLISMLRSRNAIVIFISDHGEALGEHGVYLHATPVDPLHRPACLVWYSSRYASLYPEKVSALKANCSGDWTTHSMFHTALDAAAISTPSLNRSQSFLSYEASGLD